MFGFLFYLLPVLLCYSYGFFTVGKFVHYRGLLDHKPEPEAWGAAAAWPIYLCVDPGAAKALIFPSLWLWPRFREEYPEIRAVKEGDRRHERDIRRREDRRERDEKHGSATLDDARAEVRHAKAMEAIRRDTDMFREKLIKDYPPAIEASEKYDPVTREVIDSKAVELHAQTVPEQEADVYCTRHKHFVSLKKLNDPYNNCTDREGGAIVGYQ